MARSEQTVSAIRFGYGFYPAQPAPRGADDLMRSLTSAAAFDTGLGGPSLLERARMMQAVQAARKRAKGSGMKAEVKAAQDKVKAMFAADLRQRILAPVRSPHGFFERLAWFWGDHFAVRASSLRQKSLVARLEPDAICPHITGRFSDMLRAVVTHPAMLEFLNQTSSMGPSSQAGMKRGKGLNENLAREVIELHTLGVGANYAQKDVRQFAELLTGLTIENDTGEMVFRPRRAEPGAETVLGQTYGGPGRAELDDVYNALDDLAAHPATARHIASKLARHFTSDTPSEALITSMATAFTRSNGNLPKLYEAMLDHPESWSSFGQKVKQPFDFIVSSLRCSGLTDNEATRPQRPLRRMAQLPYFPPGPQGWPEEAEAWITPSGLAERIDWATRIGQQIAPDTDPRNLLDIALRDYASDETTFAATKAAERWEGIALIIASPEFNRR